MLVDIKEFGKIITKPQPHPDFACHFIPFEHKLGEQRGWTMLDGEGVREAEIVLGNYVWVGQGHRILPEEDKSFHSTGVLSVKTC